MDGLARMSGAGCGFFIDGATWLMQPLRLRHWGEIEHRILSTRPGNPLAEVTRVLPKIAQFNSDLARHLLDKTTADFRNDRDARVVSFEQVLEWVNTADGVCYTAWCCLRECHNPRFVTLEGVTEAVMNLGDQSRLQEFVLLRDQLSGIDLMASSDWPDQLAGIRPSRRAKREQELMKLRASWRKNFYVLAINHGFTAQQANELTLYQLKVYNSKEEELGIKAASGEGGGFQGGAGTMSVPASRRDLRRS